MNDSIFVGGGAILNQELVRHRKSIKSPLQALVGTPNPRPCMSFILRRIVQRLLKYERGLKKKKQKAKLHLMQESEIMRILWFNYYWSQEQNDISVAYNWLASA